MAFRDFLIEMTEGQGSLKVPKMEFFKKAHF